MSDMACMESEFTDPTHTGSGFMDLARMGSGFTDAAGKRSEFTDTGRMRSEFERSFDAVCTMAKTMLAPWGGVEACVDAYEAAVRAATDAQLNAARLIEVEPLRSIAASCADLTRDLGATHLSSARWILDVCRSGRA